MKIFVASFNRASSGALSLLIKKLEKERMLAREYSEADYILAVGDRIETYNFIMDRYRENKKIIHLWAGEISQALHDEVYRPAMTLMSMLQLCTNENAKKRVELLCKAVDKKSNVYVVGNVMLDNLKIDESKVPKEEYDLVLYNPPTTINKEELKKEIEQVKNLLTNRKYFWIVPNGDFGSDLIIPYINTKNLPRPQFLGLLKNCRRFISNSSCIFYEAQFLLKNKQIIHIGKRNKERESKYTDMKIKNASDNIIRILKEVK